MFLSLENNSKRKAKEEVIWKVKSWNYRKKSKGRKGEIFLSLEKPRVWQDKIESVISKVEIEEIFKKRSEVEISEIFLIGKASRLAE